MSTCWEAYSMKHVHRVLMLMTAREETYPTCPASHTGSGNPAAAQMSTVPPQRHAGALIQLNTRSKHSGRTLGLLAGDAKPSHGCLRSLHRAATSRRSLVEGVQRGLAAFCGLGVERCAVQESSTQGCPDPWLHDQLLHCHGLHLQQHLVSVPGRGRQAGTLHNTRGGGQQKTVR